MARVRTGIVSWSPPTLLTPTPCYPATLILLPLLYRLLSLLTSLRENCTFKSSRSAHSCKMR